MSEIKKYIKKLVNGMDLTEDEAARCTQIITLGGATPAQIAAYLASLASKGETSPELLGTIKLLRKKMHKIDVGSQVMSLRSLGTADKDFLNISLPSSLIIASAGIKILDHGNYSPVPNATAELLKEAGANIHSNLELHKKNLEEINYTFMLENKYIKNISEFSLLKFELGIKTIFDLVIPFANPAMPMFHLIGVPDPKWLKPLVTVMRELGIKAGWVVCSKDGIDKISVAGKTQVAEFKNGKIREFTISPEDFGIMPYEDLKAIENHKIRRNGDMFRNVLLNKEQCYRDICLVNSAAGLFISGKACNLNAAMDLSRKLLETSKPLELLKKVVETSNLEILPQN